MGVALTDAVVALSMVLAVVGAVDLPPGCGVHGAVRSLGNVVDGEDIRTEEILGLVSGRIR